MRFQHYTLIVALLGFQSLAANATYTVKCPEPVEIKCEKIEGLTYYACFANVDNKEWVNTELQPKEVKVEKFSELLGTVNNIDRCAYNDNNFTLEVPYKNCKPAKSFKEKEMECKG